MQSVSTSPSRSSKCTALRPLAEWFTAIATTMKKVRSEDQAEATRSFPLSGVGSIPMEKSQEISV